MEGGGTSHSPLSNDVSIRQKEKKINGEELIVSDFPTIFPVQFSFFLFFVGFCNFTLSSKYYRGLKGLINSLTKIENLETIFSDTVVASAYSNSLNCVTKIEFNLFKIRKLHFFIKFIY